MQRDYFNVLECYSQPDRELSRETNKSYSSGELRDEFKAGLEKGVLWGQRWWVKRYHSQHLLSWVMREFRYQGTPKKWKGHFEGNISAPLLYWQNTGNQWCYMMTTKWEGEPSAAEVWWGHVCSLLCEWHQRQFEHWSLQQVIPRNENIWGRSTWTEVIKLWQLGHTEQKLSCSWSGLQAHFNRDNG